MWVDQTFETQPEGAVPMAPFLREKRKPMSCVDCMCGVVEEMGNMCVGSRVSAVVRAKIAT